MIFRDETGRELTLEELGTVTGKIRWEIVYGGHIPAEARELHNKARQAGDYHKALELLAEAHRLAPDWPYPLYDMAWTYLLQGDTAKALEYYEQVDRMAPRGFFTSKEALDCLRRETMGKLPSGSYLQLVLLES
ncbi:MAG: tetratricopeptide repeat protein, partial [Candidatus Acidoferrales bacterium]